MRLKKVIETCLYSHDLARAKAFYADLLSLEFYAEEKGRHVFLKMPDASMLLIFNPIETSKQVQLLPPRAATGPQHLAFEVEKSDYLAWKERLLQAGTAILHEQIWKNNVKAKWTRLGRKLTWGVPTVFTTM